MKQISGTSLAERLGHYTLINPETGCHEWSGCKSRGGYGQIRAAGRTAKAHRVAWELANGPIPPGLQLDHLCRNRACVNPAHLEPVTQRENVVRGIGPTAVNAAKTHCPRGHALSGDNLAAHEIKLGYRKCRACKLAQNRASKAAKRQASSQLRVAAA